MLAARRISNCYSSFVDHFTVQSLLATLMVAPAFNWDCVSRHKKGGFTACLHRTVCSRSSGPTSRPHKSGAGAPLGLTIILNFRFGPLFGGNRLSVHLMPKSPSQIARSLRALHNADRLVRGVRILPGPNACEAVVKQFASEYPAMPCLPCHSLNAQGIAVNASMCRLAVRSFVAYAQPKSRLQNHCIERNRVNTWGFAPASEQVLKQYLSGHPQP